IGGVHGKTEFETYEAAKEHAEYYASVFEAKYGGDINFSGYMDENLENYMPDYEFYKVIFDRKYELTINVFEPDKDRKAYASIILTYAPTAPEYENWKNLVDEEFDKLSIDAAHSEGALRGIE
ncbi:MAG: hypothetical protein AB8B83_03535, partial [Bdellovibrionales bacterium]